MGYTLDYEKCEKVSGVKCWTSPKILDYFYEKKIIITDVVCGKDFTFACDDYQNPYSWGNNDHSQLARNSKNKYETVPDIANLLLSFGIIMDIKCGWMHGSLLTDKGEVFIWGNPFYDYDEQMPDIKEPLKIELDNTVLDINCGFHHFCAIVIENNNYVLYTWGANEYGQCGYKTEEKLSLTPKKVDLDGILQVYCGPFQTICHLSGGKLYGFGHNL